MTYRHSPARDLAASADDQTDESSLPEIPAEEQRTDDYEAAITICLRSPNMVLLDLRRAVLDDRALSTRAGTILNGAALTDSELRSELDRCSFQGATCDRCRMINSENARLGATGDLYCLVEADL